MNKYVIRYSILHLSQFSIIEVDENGQYKDDKITIKNVNDYNNLIVKLKQNSSLLPLKEGDHVEFEIGKSVKAREKIAGFFIKDGKEYVVFENHLIYPRLVEDVRLVSNKNSEKVMELLDGLRVLLSIRGRKLQKLIESFTEIN